jgi:hypothetical protein
MVAGSASTRGIAALLASPSGAAGTVPLFAELQGIRTDRGESAAEPGGIEERPHDWEADYRQHRPEEWSRNSWNEIHVSNNA